MDNCANGLTTDRDIPVSDHYGTGMAGGTPQALAGQRILIAEDEAIIAMFLEDVIERLGGDIVGSAKHCDEALTLLEAGSVEAILLDLHLEGGTSKSVIVAATAKHVPVLVCTGSDVQALPTAFRNLPLLKKPWQSGDVEVHSSSFFA